ncbi:MFS transporter, partial [Alicyclobacillaceae bacterium I2511]
MSAAQRFALSVLLATFLAAWDSTVVGTIGPTIVQHLGGLNLYPWMLTGFMVAATTLTPLVGSLSNHYSPAILYRWSIGFFLLGSVGSAVAESMSWFIGTRIMQGAGAGGILTLGLIMMGQYYQGVERVRMQGRLSAMWGLAGLLGPTLGGLFAQWLSWRFLFLINVPVGLIALFVMGPVETSRAPTGAMRLDWRGALWLVAWLSTGLSSITAFQQFPHTAVGWILLFSALGLGIIWWNVERRAVNPLVPLSWLKSRRITPPSLLALVASGTLYATVIVIPLWVYTAWHFAPLAVGLAILPLPVGWAAGSMFTAPLMSHFSLQAITRGGLLGMIVGMLLYQMTWNGGEWILIVCGSGVLGMGVGVV